MFRCPHFFAGVALVALASNAAAITLYQDNFNPSSGSPSIGPQWDFTGVQYGMQLIEATGPNAPASVPKNFLGEFGGAQMVDSAGHLQPTTGDVVKLTLTLPQNTATVSLSFDLYLLRTWDGGTSSTFGGPDTFVYGYTRGQASTDVLSASFSNGAGSQTYCPGTQLTSCEATFGSVLAAKNNLGFTVARDPHGPGPAVGEPFSLLYEIPGTPIQYTGGGDITFYFLSRGLQLVASNEFPNLTANAQVPAVADESWGISGVRVTYTVAVPEPATWMLVLCGMALLALSARRRLAR